MTSVVRVGDTVRRTAGPWTPTVHALLEHLHDEGFTLVPRPSGVDDRGREVLSFLPGEVVNYPLPDFVLADTTLLDVARLLRRFHDASATFVPSDGAIWQWAAHRPAEVVCHNDFAPYNLVWVDGRVAGVIDFDTASPGPRIWDVAYTAYRFVPLTDPGNPDVPFPGLDEQVRRLGLLCDGYDWPGVRPGAVVTAAGHRLEGLVRMITDSAAAGDPAQRAVLERGHVEIYERDLAWLRLHRDAF